LKFHKSHGHEGTSMVTKVDEPSKYGVVLYDDTGRIENFVEKPKEYVGNKINAGIYIFNRRILNRIPRQPTSIEKEIFPKMAKEGELYAMELKGFWMDVGQPKDFLAGMCKYLSSLKEKKDISLQKENENFIGPVLIDPSAKIGKDCLIGPYVVIGPRVTIEDGARIKRTTIMEGCIIKSNSWINHSILGWHSTIGRWVRIDNVSVLGKDVTVADEIYINGGKILPHKAINEHIPKPAIIM